MAVKNYIFIKISNLPSDSMIDRTLKLGKLN